jgi:polyribonucleotide nucleotidyltransferase
MATKDLNPAFIKKQKVQSLMEIADKYKIPYPSSIKKPELISRIHEYIYHVCLDPIEKVNASKIDLVTIGRNIQLKFDDLLTNIEGGIQSIDKIIIENQISPIANRMKTIQGMIAQYFIMKNNYIEIDFVNASNKLKWLDKESGSGSGPTKTTYSERKKKSLAQTIDFLKERSEEDWLAFFMKNKKKDDLGDCFLQALWYFFMKDLGSNGSGSDGIK